MTLRPEILRHPNIPKPLHGVAPRVVKGREWWDITRQKAYEESGFRCWACGVERAPRSQGAFFIPDFDEIEDPVWLEAHEYYDINYKTGRVRLAEVVALCHECHNFIHSGRLLAIWRKKEISPKKALGILEHGFEVLGKAGLQPQAQAAVTWMTIQGYSEESIRKMLYSKGLIGSDDYIEPWEAVPWSQWHLEIDGECYYSRFQNYNEWAAHYGEDPRHLE